MDNFLLFLIEVNDINVAGVFEDQTRIKVDTEFLLFFAIENNHGVVVLFGVIVAPLVRLHRAHLIGFR